jgi:SulP family sulfate permease
MGNLHEPERAELPPVVILRLRHMTAIDAIGWQAIEDALHWPDRALILCGAREQPARLMRQAEFERRVGTENICAPVKAALERAEVMGQAMREAPA